LAFFTESSLKRASEYYTVQAGGHAKSKKET